MHEEYLQQARHCLSNSGVLAYPTEAVYGLGCVPQATAAIERILNLKQRPVTQGMILVAADFSQLGDYVEISACRDTTEILASWPGPVTWIMPATELVPVGIKSDDDTVAVRVSACQDVIELCRLAGAIVSTSANPKGLEPARSHLEVEKYFQDAIDYIVPGEIVNSASVSEIRNAITGEIIRSGNKSMKST